MSQPRVAILTPTYNHEDFIGDCIESVLGQTMPDWEMIVVDDGSSDATADIVESYKDSRIRLVRQPNKGIQKLHETYNGAFGLTNAPVMAILEGDDYWPAEKLNHQLPDFDDKNVVLSSGLFLSADQEGDVYDLLPHGDLPEEARSNQPVGSAALFMLSHRYLTYTFPVSTMLRAQALDRIGGFCQPDYLPLVDYPTFLRISVEGNWVFHRRILGYWRRHRASTTRNTYPQIINGVYRHVSVFIRDHHNEIPASCEDWRKLDQDWRFYQLERMIVLHRYLMHLDRRKEAAEVLQRALDCGVHAKTRAMIQTAILASRMGRGTEALFHLGRRGDWRIEFASPMGDQVVSDDMGPQDFDLFDLVKAAGC